MPYVRESLPYPRAGGRGGFFHGLRKIPRAGPILRRTRAVNGHKTSIPFLPATGIVLASPTGIREVCVVKNVSGVALVVMILSAAGGTASAQGAVEQGQKVFAAQKCVMCHAIAGKGNAKGSLDAVGTKLSADEIRQWVVNAPEMAAKAKAERKPAMKAFASLSKDDLDGLVAYLQGLKK